MSKQAAFAKVVEAFAPRSDDRLDRRVFWEIRCARLRLALAESELAWVQELLVSGHINATGALQILDDAMDQVAGVKP